MALNKVPDALITLSTADNQVIFSSGNAVTGNTNFTWNNTSSVLTVTGNANVGNIGSTHSIHTGNGTFGNINSVTGILSVTGNVTASANLAVTSNITAGNINSVSGILSVTGNANVGNIGATNANITSMTATGAVNMATSTGNVGIGTTSPGTKFHVYSSSAVNTFVRVDNGSGYLDIGPLSNGALYAGYGAPAASTSMAFGTSNANPVLFYTNASERMRIDSSGNVGIGTTSPATRLEVAASTSAFGVKLPSIVEVVNVVASAPTSTTNFYINNGDVQYYTSNNSTNWTLNFALSSSTSLNTGLGTGQSVTVCLVVTNGGSAYYPTAHQVDGSAVTVKWQGGTAPSSGNASALDVYVYTIIKTASATYTVLGSQTKFA